MTAFTPLRCCALCGRTYTGPTRPGAFLCSRCTGRRIRGRGVVPGGVLVLNEVPYLVLGRVGNEMSVRRLGLRNAPMQRIPVRRLPARGTGA